jgi:predicted deacylase
MTVPEPAPGTRLETTLTVPAGADSPALELPLLLIRGRRPGPRIAILGGVHGDEYEGIVAAGALWHDIDPATLAGLLTIVPVSNPPAYAAGTRTSPLDGANLARVFPGGLAGTATERIAHVLAESIIRPAEFLFDLHSAGQHYAMPLLAGAYDGDDALGRRCTAAALAFGAPVYWAHPELAPGRTLSVAADAGIPNLYVECGGGGRVRPNDLAAYLAGVRRVLALLGALPDASIDPALPPRVRLRSTGDLDTWLTVQHAGILVERVRVLDEVVAGQVLGEVRDERGRVLESLTAPFDGVVIMARRTARVRPTDGAYMIALPAPTPSEEPRP